MADDTDSLLEGHESVDWPIAKLLGRYGFRHWPKAAAGIVAAIVGQIAGIVPPFVLGVAIDSVFRQEQPFDLPLVPQSLLPEAQTEQFLVVVAIVFLAFFGGAFFQWVEGWAWNALAQHLQHAARTDAYEKMQRLNMKFFDDRQTGELMSVLSNDINNLEEFFTQGLNQVAWLTVMVSAIALLMAYLNWQLALVALLPVPIICLLAYKFTGIVQPKYARVRSTVGSLNTRLENNLSGIEVIKTSNAETHEDERVHDASYTYFDANWDAITTQIKFLPGTRVLAGAGFGMTFVVGGVWVLSGPPLFFTEPLTVGELVTFLLYTERFVWPVSKFGQLIDTHQRASASGRRLFTLLEADDRIAETDDDRELAVTDARVKYDDVRFGYGEESIIEGVDFEVEPGQTVAFVGPTGAGKSTLLKLLVRMYDIDGGTIRIDGTDICDVTLRSLREHVGYVSQETFLFSGTIRDNIRFGTFDATAAEVRAAARAAEAHEFIENLPEGYDTKVGERGVKLSGGQRQRITIARAILKDPEILILDEATSDVDTETEMLIQHSLDELTADRTTFVIAHRLSTVVGTDQIFVIEDGQIRERGTHEKLLDVDGLYARFWAVQVGETDSLPQEFVERVADRKSYAELLDD